MAKKAKFTFKLHPKAKGLAAVGNSRQDCDVKLNTLRVGLIHAPNWATKGSEYAVSFAVKHTDEENPNRKWKWVRLTKTTPTLDEMKEWLNKVADQVVDKYDLHSFTD